MASHTYRFGDFRLDPASRQLWHGDQEVVLHRKAFDCIVHLIEHRDRAVERDELLAAVWGDVHLSDSAVAQAIFEARRAVNDTGQEQRVIRTMWGFGYRWVAPVEVAEPPSRDVMGPYVEAPETPGRRSVWLAVLLALLVVGTLTGGTVYLSRDSAPGGGDEKATHELGAGEVALLLPVTVAADDERFAWIRLGVMDLIGQRLRAAGQPTVPSDSVIALLRGSPSKLRPEDLERLATSTGASLVLQARATVRDDGWRVSLRSVRGIQPPVKALADAPDVLDAARLAADRLTLSIGLAPAPEPTSEPGLTTLFQQTRAAVLAQRHDVARELIEDADPALRRHPKVRLQIAFIELHSHHVDMAQEILESLLSEVSADRNAEFRARVLHHIAWAHMYRANPAPAQAALEEGVRLLAGEAAPPPLLGRIESTLGNVILNRDDADTAELHFARARVILQGSGDAIGLAALDNYLGLLAIRRERYAEALVYFRSAAEQAAAMHDLGNELGNLANIVWMRLGLLDYRGALEVEPRIDELLAQVDSPLVTATGRLVKALLLDADGRTREAASLLDEVLRATDSDDLIELHVEALRHRADQLARAGDFRRAAPLAAAAVELAPPELTETAAERGHAWLTSIRAHLAMGDLPSAATAAEELGGWALQQESLPPRIDAALAEAELAAAEDRVGDTEAAFQRALELADGSSVPVRSLRVAESYVPWLLTVGPQGTPDPERALAVANRVARYADRHYGAALLQLRVAHALGIPSAWRIALADARSLAGQRQIPAELMDTPSMSRPAAGG